MSEYPCVTEWRCPGDHGCMLLDLGPGSVDLVCEDPNCTYDPFESGPLSPLDDYDPVTKPRHYRSQVPGVECWDVLRHFPWLRGSAMKYLWRAGDKGDIVEDLRKSIAFIQKEIDSIEEDRAREGSEGIDA